MRAAAKSDTGLVRPINEDSYCLDCAPGTAFIAVADGMGGHNAGEVASAIAADTFRTALMNAENKDADTVCAAFRAANLAIYDQAEADNKLNGMGTTMTAAVIDENKVTIAHVGDSRAYLLRNGTLRQITQDHSLVEEMVRAGILTHEEAAVHPRRNVITRALGVKLSVEIDSIEMDVQPGDKWMICSDGLVKHVSDEEIEQIMQHDAAPAEIASELVALTLERGGSDNVTCAILDNEEAAE